MTNKVKPFYIRITGDMTPQMVQDAFDKCVDAGAALDEGCSHTNSRYEYKRQYNPSLFKFFGVDDSHMTYMDIDLEFFMDAQEITLDQLDEWLGLEVEGEWKNGDECVFEGNEYIFVGLNPYNKDIAIIQGSFGKPISPLVSTLSKPETPEQKDER